MKPFSMTYKTLSNLDFQLRSILFSTLFTIPQYKPMSSFLGLKHNKFFPASGNSISFYSKFSFLVIYVTGSFSSFM